MVPVSEKVYMKELHQQKAKFLTFVLRHKPDAIPGLVIDEKGWAPVSAFVPSFMTDTELHEIVITDSKGRFEVRSTNGVKYVRCKYGHSIETVKSDGEAETAFPDLYHATTTKAYENIKEHGIKSMTRNMVHMSSDRRTAVGVALRYAKNMNDVVVLKITNPETLTGLIHVSQDIWVAPEVPVTHFTKEE